LDEDVWQELVVDGLTYSHLTRERVILNNVPSAAFSALTLGQVTGRAQKPVPVTLRFSLGECDSTWINCGKDR